jgi:hypothetical protein
MLQRSRNAPIKRGLGSDAYAASVEAAIQHWRRKAHGPFSSIDRLHSGIDA